MKALIFPFALLSHVLEEVIDKDLETKENAVVSPRQEVVITSSPNVKREEYVPQVFLFFD
jgi:hypothetical protein